MRKLIIDKIKNHLLETPNIKLFTDVIKQDIGENNNKTIVQIPNNKQQNNSSLNNFESEYELFVKEQEMIINIKTKVLEILEPIIKQYIDDKIAELVIQKKSTRSKTKSK